MSAVRTGAGDTSRASLSFALFGTPRLRAGDTDQPAGPPRRRAVLGFLAANAGRVVSRDELVAAVWGSEAPNTAAGNLHTYVADLRKALRTSGHDPTRVLPTLGSGYRLDAADTAIDIRVFEHAVTSATRQRQSGQYQTAIEESRRALRLWTSTPLAGIDAPYAVAERSRLSNLRLAGIAELVEALLARGESMDTLVALRTLDDALEAHPMHERFAELRIRILCHRGRRSEAVAQFEDTRNLLASTFGVDPGPRMRQAYRDTLAPHARRPTAIAHLRRSPTKPHRPGGQPSPEIVGRQQELEFLRRQDHGENDSRPVLVDGPPGAGKSALAREFTRRHSTRFPGGCHVIALPDAGADEETVLRTAIAALEGSGAPHPDTARALHDRYLSLFEGRRALLVLDGAHSIQQVRLLLPRHDSMALICSRFRLTGLTALDGARRLTLGPLSRWAARAVLAAPLAGAPTAQDSAVLDELAVHCDFLPFALRCCAEQLRALSHPMPRQLLDALRSDPTAVLDFSENSDTEPPDSVRGRFDTTLASLPPEATELLGSLGSRKPPEFTVTAAASAARWPTARTRSILENLANANLLSCTGPDRYDIPRLVRLYASTLPSPYPAPADDASTTGHHARTVT